MTNLIKPPARRPAPLRRSRLAVDAPVARERVRRSTFVLRTSRVSGRVDRRTAVACAGLVAVIVVGVIVSVRIGDFPLPLSDVTLAIVGQGSEDANFIVRGLRLPRALTGLMVGLAFGVSGAIFQSIARNPLASPDVVGVTAGASLAAVSVIVFFGAGTMAIAGASVGGGLAASLLVYRLAYRKGVTGYRLVLVGVGITAVGTNLTSYLLTRSSIYQAQEASIWLTGSLNNRGWDDVVAVGLALLLIIPPLMVLAPQLRALHLGDDTARGLGVRVEPARIALLLGALSMASLATAAAGPVAFVALVAPQIARRLCASSGIDLVPAALSGAAIVLLADLAARLAFAPTTLPVGVVTAIIGAPFLLWLLARANRTGRTG